MINLSVKQKQAFGLLTDSSLNILGYGGGAGGGKTYLGCYYNLVMHSCLNGSKSFIGRDSLKDTRESVLFTFRKVARQLKISNWKYNDNHIIFNNGSEIEFLDLSFQPNKDPEYERFGSKEYTWGWIEEAGPVHPKAFEVLDTRLGRWYNEEFGMPGKMLVTFNPRRNWLYNTFYLPYKTGREIDRIKFMPALYKDNPNLPEEYVKRLKAIKDKATRERLLLGNFDYEDDPTSLLQYDDIYNIWHNHHIAQNPTKYLTADIARFGSDKAIIIVWEGWRIIEYYVLDISATTRIQQIINALRTKWSIPATQCIADEDGVGGGVVDNCGIIGFQNGGAAKDKAYYRIKDECGYEIANHIQKIHFQADVNLDTQNRIENELAQLKTYEADKDGKLRILPKVKIKENIGHSPDWLDNFIMRAFFEIYNPINYLKARQEARRIFC